MQNLNNSSFLFDEESIPNELNRVIYIKSPRCNSDIEIVDVSCHDNQISPTMIETDSLQITQKYQIRTDFARKKLASQKGQRDLTSWNQVVVPEILCEPAENSSIDFKDIVTTNDLKKTDVSTVQQQLSTALATMVVTQPYLHIQNRLENQIQLIQQKLEDLERVAGMCSVGLDLIPTSEWTTDNITARNDELRASQYNSFDELQRRQISIQDRLLVLTEQMHAQNLFHHSYGCSGHLHSNGQLLNSTGGLSSETPLASHSDYVFTQNNHYNGQTRLPSALPISITTNKQIRNSRRNSQNCEAKLTRKLEKPKRSQHTVIEQKSQGGGDIQVNPTQQMEKLNNEIDLLRREFKLQLEEIKRVLSTVPVNIIEPTIDREDWLSHTVASSERESSKVEPNKSVLSSNDVPISQRSPRDQYPLDKQFAAYQPSTVLDKFLVASPIAQVDWSNNSNSNEDGSNTLQHRLKLAEAETVLIHVQRRRENLEANLAAVERTRDALVLPNIIGLMQQDDASAGKARIRALVDEAIHSLKPKIDTAVQLQLKSVSPAQQPLTLQESIIKKRLDRAEEKKKFYRPPSRTFVNSKQMLPSAYGNFAQTGLNRRRINSLRRPYLHLINDSKLAKPPIISFRIGQPILEQPTYRATSSISQPPKDKGYPEADAGRHVTFKVENKSKAAGNLDDVGPFLLSIRQYSMLQLEGQTEIKKQNSVVNETPLQSSLCLSESGEGLSFLGDQSESDTNDGIWRQKLEDELLDGLLKQLYSSKDHLPDTKHNLGQLQRAIDEELMQVIGETLLHNPVTQSKDNFCLINTRVHTPTLSSVFVPVVEILNQQILDKTRLSETYSDDFTTPNLSPHLEAHTFEDEIKSESSSLLPIRSRVSTPEKTSTQTLPAPRMTDKAFQTEYVYNEKERISICVGPSETEEGDKGISSTFPGNQLVEELKSEVDHESIISSVPFSHLEADLTDTNAESFSDGMWLYDRSEGQEPDWCADPVFKEKLGPLPMFMNHSTDLISPSQDLEKSQVSNGEFIPHPTFILEPIFLTSNGEAREGSCFVPITSHKRPVPPQCDPLLTVMSNRFRYPYTEFPELNHSKDQSTYVDQVILSDQVEGKDSPSETSLQVIYQKINDRKRIRISQRQNDQNVSMGEFSDNISLFEDKMSFHNNVEGFTEPMKPLVNVKREPIKVLQSSNVNTLQPTPMNYVLPSTDFTETGLLSTEQIINEAFMKTGGTSRDWDEVNVIDSAEVINKQTIELEEYEKDISEISLN